MVADAASTVVDAKEFHTLNEKKCRRESNLGIEFFNFQLCPRVELDLSKTKFFVMGVSIFILYYSAKYCSIK